MLNLGTHLSVLGLVFFSVFVIVMSVNKIASRNNMSSFEAKKAKQDIAKTLKNSESRAKEDMVRNKILSLNFNNYNKTQLESQKEGKR